MPTLPPQILEKLKRLESDPKLAIFIELGLLNDRLKEVIDAVNASKTEEITVKNAEDLKLSLEPLQANFDALGASVNKVTEAIKSIPKDEAVNMSGVEKMLKQLVNKPVEKVDMSALTSMTDILDDILYAVQTTASHSDDKTENPADKIVPAIDGGNKKLLSILDTINENIVSIDIPDFDYERLAKMIGKIRMGGGGSGGNSYIRNTAGTMINPATEEKQDAIKSSIDTLKTFDTGNSTTTELAGGATFTGAWIDTTNYAQAIIGVTTSHAAATDGMVFEHSNDGITVDHYHAFSPLANTPTGHHYASTLDAKYFRVRYTNGATLQTSFILSTYLFRVSTEEGHVHPLEYVIDADHQASIHRAVLVAKNPSGTYGNINRTAAGNLKMSLEEIDGATALAIPSGTAANGTRDLTSANTWYAVPSTVPTVDYVLDYTLETAVGDIRTGYDNTGTPSTTNGMIANGSVVGQRMGAGQVLYFASSVALDAVNWSTKEI